MIKHLPEGITPFEGYARYPLFPLENADFEVGCLYEDAACVPMRCWHVSGAAQPELPPYRAENGRYRFHLQGLSCGAKVTYAFRTDGERMKEFCAPVCHEYVRIRPDASTTGFSLVSRQAFFASSSCAQADVFCRPCNGTAHSTAPAVRPISLGSCRNSAGLCSTHICRFR